MLIASLIALATVGGGTATYLMTQDGGRGTAASAAAFDAGAETSAESHDGAIELAAADPPPVQDDPPKTPTTDDPPSHRDKPTRTSAPSKPAPAPTPAPTPTKADPVESAKPVPDKKDDTGITHIGGVTFIDGAKQAESATGLKSLSFKPTFNTKAFKAEKWWRTAKKHAEKLMPDLVLTDFEVKYVMSNGLANLSYRGAEASYWFRSKSRSKRPKNIPRGVEHEIYCMVYVDVSKSKIQVYAASREKCRGSLRPPRCSLKHVMKKAREIGMPQGAAEVDLLDDGWYVQIDEWSETIPDDC